MRQNAIAYSSSIGRSLQVSRMAGYVQVLIVLMKGSREMSRVGVSIYILKGPYDVKPSIAAPSS